MTLAVRAIGEDAATELEQLRARLEEVEAALRAIRSGEVDAITVDTEAGPRIYTLRGSEEPYRAMVETMSEGAVTVSLEGVILYCNERFAEMAGAKIPKLIGANLSDLFAADDAVRVTAALRDGRPTTLRFRANLVRRSVAAASPVNLAMRALKGVGTPAVIIVVTDLTEIVASQDAAAKLTREIQHRLFELHSSENMQRIMATTVESLANAAELRSQFRQGHQRKVAKLAAAIAGEMGMPGEERGIYLAGMVHDIGLLQVPSEIVNRPFKLPPIEIQLIQEHSQAGYEILKDIGFPWPIALMVLQHHERLDGSGYPHGLKGKDIIIGARIIAVADVVEAMTEDRPHRAAPGIETALAEIERGRGELFDPGVVDACLRLFRKKGYAFEQNSGSPCQQ
jgi:PAS domain S-box-containing protein